VIAHIFKGMELNEWHKMYNNNKERA
jgi:hypothetical protein